MIQATILMPAHNEASVIGRTLLHMSRGLSPFDFKVVVIANACTDSTASKAKSTMPQAKVIETETPGKAHALNIGYKVADKTAPVICLDADVDITAECLKALVTPLFATKAKASCGHMDVVVSDASPFVRAYYKGWRTNPYFDRGKFGGVFALSAEAASTLFPLPEITADDEYVRRSLPVSEVAFVETCRFKVRAPLTLASLIRVRRRAIRGVREVIALGLPKPERQSKTTLVGRVLQDPKRIFPVAVYGCINAFVRLQLKVERTSYAHRWERDLTTRTVG
ncbi:MAG: glycosyltransferase [Rhodobacteraceae bacterium]|nr:glycosyltransferase [Paracoccaceae bacterium]